MSESLQVLAILAGKVLGPHARKIMEIIIRDGEVTDEKLSNEIGISINEVRVILNELFENRLVKYRRIRDEKIGWYTYFWRATDEDPVILLEDRRKKTLEILKIRLEYERTGPSYYCPQCKRKYSFDQAAELMFKCIDCGTILEYLDSSDKIVKLENIIKKLEKLKFVKI